MVGPQNNPKAYARAKRQWKESTPVDIHTLNRQISNLKSEIAVRSTKFLQYKLAELLRKRAETAVAEPGDVQQAAIHAALAVGEDVQNTDHWILHARLQAELYGIDAGMRVIDQAKRAVPPASNLFSVYRKGADLLVNFAKNEDALQLLLEGIKVIPEQSLCPLYEAAAEQLVELGKRSDAIRLLEEGVKRIPPKFLHAMLYQRLGLLHCLDGSAAEAIASQRQGFRLAAPKSNGYKLIEGALFYAAGSYSDSILQEILDDMDSDAFVGPQRSLGLLLQLQSKGNWKGSLSSAQQAREKYPKYVHLAALHALAYLAIGEHENALRSVTSVPDFKTGVAKTHTWLLALIYMKLGDRAKASEALAQYFNREINPNRELSESFLLQLWYQKVTIAESHNLCFHLPILPSRLVGLSEDVRRIPFAPPALTGAKAVVPAVVPFASIVPPRLEFGSYSVEATIAAGAAGKVYKAKHKETGEIVAIKVMKTDGGPTEEVTFKREREALMRLESIAGVIKLLDLDCNAEQIILYIEYADGGNLEDYVLSATAKKLQITETKSIAEALVNTMIAVHAKGYVHRDLKPKNILRVGQDWKIADFGISKLLDRPFTAHTLLHAGTPGYMAPEQQRGEAASFAADIHALGKTLLFMLEGMIDEGAVDRIKNVALRNLIAECVEERAGDRPSSMEEINTRLKYVRIE